MGMRRKPVEGLGLLPSLRVHRLDSVPILIERGIRHIEWDWVSGSG